MNCHTRWEDAQYQKRCVTYEDGDGGRLMVTVSGRMMLANTSAEELVTTLSKPELDAALLIAAMMLSAKATVVATAVRDYVHRTALLSEPCTDEVGHSGYESCNV